MRRLNYIVVVLVMIFGSIPVSAKDYRFTDDRNKMVLEKLASGAPELKEALKSYNSGDHKSAFEKVANYFSAKMSERFFFDHSKLDTEIKDYREFFPDKQKQHARRAKSMMELYPPDSDWNLPMESNSGKMISAYELRHLARQHKLVDVAFEYLLDNDRKKYDYMLEMPVSLEKAYIADTFERDGNSVFESFRAGYRVFNWLWVYNLLLSDSNFTPEDNFLFVRTFYYHAVDLANRVEKFRYGNHHTKGVMALSLIAILFPEFEESADWLEMSKKLLTEHITKEVNEDGFQLERSIHYHIGDIDNYFYVYYLAGLNKIDLPDTFNSQFYRMFGALTVLAHPDKTLPVLQDDTDNPWSYYKRMGSIMALGTVLFEEPTFKFFASDKILSDKFWFVRPEDRKKLQDIVPKQPGFLSNALPSTGYYSMRNGWDDNSMVVTVSAGLSENKPDHQHGDMLGIQLFAFNNVMLPNYQVRYYLEELPYFKNSFSKNVCVVDSIPHGREWKGNKGGSGFGKFLELPEPKVNGYLNLDGLDFFEGTVSYENASFERKIYFIHDGFVIVKDILNSGQERNYQQIWQGYYSEVTENHFRSTTADGGGLEIIQLEQFDSYTNSPIVWGKSSILFEQNGISSAQFVTLLYPFSQFDTRIDERKNLEKSEISGWEFFRSEFRDETFVVECEYGFGNKEFLLLFDVAKLGNAAINVPDFNILLDRDSGEITLLGSGEFELTQSEKRVVLSGLKKYNYEEFRDE